MFSMRVLILGQLLKVDYWTKYKTLWLDKSSANLFCTPSEGFVKICIDLLSKSSHLVCSRAKEIGLTTENSLAEYAKITVAPGLDLLLIRALCMTNTL